MSTAGGISAQFGMADETTFGTIVTPARFLEFNSESLALSVERIESQGLRPARRVLRSAQWLPGRVGVSGPVEFDVQSNGFGLLLKHMLGQVASAQPNAGSFPTVWEHTAKVGPTDGKSFTCQFGRADSAGTINPFTYAGAKVSKWELSCDAENIVTLNTTLDAISETTATALATASYTAGSVPLVYTGGVITIGGTPTDTMKFSMAGDNAQQLDRYMMRATTPTAKKEQLEGNAIRKYTGSIGCEFMGLTEYNRFVNGTVGSLTAFFSGGTIAGTFKTALEVTLPAVRFDGSTPNVNGANLIDITLPFVALDDGAGTGGVQMLYRTTDATP